MANSSIAMWLNENEDVGHIDAFMPPAGGREFTHLHLAKDLGNLTKIIETETNPETVKSQNISK